MQAKYEEEAKDGDSEEGQLCPNQDGEWMSEIGLSSQLLDSKSFASIVSSAKSKETFKGKVRTMDISEASSAKPLMEYLIKASHGKYKLSLSKDKCDIRYLFCNIDEEEICQVIMAKNRIVNRYPGVKGISHKDYFARWTKICIDQAPTGYSFIPPSFEFPKERQKLVEYMQGHKGSCFIAKPQKGS